MVVDSLAADESADDEVVLGCVPLALDMTVADSDVEVAPVNEDGLDWPAPMAACCCSACSVGMTSKAVSSDCVEARRFQELGDFY